MKSERRALTLIVLGAGAVLLAGLLAAPFLPLPGILAATVAWYLALGVLCWAALRILAPRVGRRTALLLIGLVLLAPMVITAIRPGGPTAVKLPCPRNWAWLPAWFLRSSPLGSLRFEVGEAKLKLCYGRPAARGRRMLGGSRVAYGQLWRTGANEPTTLITSAPLEVAGIAVPAGRVALYTIPGPESWELIVNAATSQWGIESEYTAEVRSRELGRAILPSSKGEHMERLTWSVEAGNNDPDRVELVLSWETTRLRIPLRAALR